MKEDEIINGIASYKEQQQQILDAISEHGGKLHQDEFDNEFGDWSKHVLKDGTAVEFRRPTTLWLTTDDSFILGNLFVSSDWQRYLHLLQLMVQCGLVTVEGAEGDVVYR